MSVRHARAPFVAVAAVAIGILVAGCGNDSSSDEVTTTSLAETSTSQSAEPTSDAAVPPADSATSAPESPAAPAPAPADPGAATAPPADQSEVPAVPGPTDDRGQAFVAALRDRGMPVVDNGDLAVSTANYICTAQAQGEDASLITTYVTAMVGSEASAAGVTLTDEQAAANAATYIEVADSTYC